MCASLLHSRTLLRTPPIIKIYTNANSLKKSLHIVILKGENNFELLSEYTTFRAAF